MSPLTEVSPPQVDYYANVVKRLIGGTGYFIEQNYVVEGVHTDAKGMPAKVTPITDALEDTIADRRGRGDVDIWASKYIGAVFDASDGSRHSAIRYDRQ